MPSPAVTGAAVSGLLFGLSLIVAIGPQNVFVVRQGALRQHVGTVVAICAVSDAVLIAAGVAGMGAAIAGAPWLREATRVAGAAALLAYATLAARRCIAARGIEGVAAPRAARSTVIVACLAFTWLNPAVYLDTIVLLGSVAHSLPGRQWWFGAGAALGSVLWFIALALAARVAAPALTRPRAWRVLDGFVAVVMTVTATRLLLGA